MFWKRRNKPSDDTPTSPTSSKEAVQKAMQDPDSWEHLTPQQLLAVAFLCLTHDGTTQDPIEMQLLERLYGLLLARVDAAQRLGLEQRIRTFVMQGHSSAFALVPFVLGDIDHRVVSSATIDIAMLMHRTNDDPLTGPKFLVDLVEHEDTDDQRKLGILAGLILLGDERILPLVRGRWRALASPEHRRRLAAATSGYVSTLLIEFLVDWLEEATEESDIGAIAGSLARMPELAKGGRVVEVRRCFPCFNAGVEGPIQISRHWSFGEYAQVIRPRLEPLIARESEPKVIPYILDAWTQ